MEADRVEIAGVQLFRLEPHRDDRGSLTEVYRRAWVEGGREARQANLSWSHPGVLRGLHWHYRRANFWCVLSGVAHVALVDLREGSPTRKATHMKRIDAGSQRYGLSIPPGVAHGFFAETDVLMLLLVDAYYTGDDEHGLAWNDPGLGLSWPSQRPVLSERDRANPSLEQVLEEPPEYRPMEA